MIELTKSEVLHCLFDSFPARIIFEDLEGRLAYLNQQAENHLVVAMSHDKNNGEHMVHKNCEKRAKHDLHASSSRDSPSSDHAQEAEQDEDPATATATEKFPFLSFPVKDSSGTMIGTCTCDFNVQATSSNHGFLDHQHEHHHGYQDGGDFLTNAVTAKTTSATTNTTTTNSSGQTTQEKQKNLDCKNDVDLDPSQPQMHPQPKKNLLLSGHCVPLDTTTAPTVAASNTNTKKNRTEPTMNQNTPNHQQIQQGQINEDQVTCNCDHNSTHHLYHSIMQHIETAVAIHELVFNEQNQPIDYVYLDVNPAFERFLGVAAEDCIGKRVTELFPGIEQDQADWIGLFGKVGTTGIAQRFMHFSERLSNWYIGFCYRTDSKRKQFAVLFTEHSDQVESQEALRESEEQHRNLFESMMQGVVYQDATGNIIAANPAAERILGLTVDQMKGRTSVDPRWKSIREDGSDFPGSEHPSMVALQTGQPVLNATMGVFSPKSNENHWIKIDAVPRFKPGEEDTKIPWQVFTTFTDITETKRFEYKLLRAKEKAEEADKLKSAFLANMSHEIRTPINGIMGYIDLALSNDLAQDWHKENLEGLQIAKSSGALLLSIIQDILDLSKIEAGQMIVNNDESFSIKSTMAQTSSLANALIKTKKKNITFSCIVDTEMKDIVLGDPFRLQQVVNNLVSNGIKFTDWGKVELRISLVDHETLEFSLLDTGKGIPASHIESIFEPFRQVEISDTRQHGGTGLGLTISRKLVELMGGKLRVESSVLGPIRGSFFAFTLPYRPQQSSMQLPLPYQSVPVPVPRPTHNTIQQSPNGYKRDAGTSIKYDQTNDTRRKSKILVAEDDPVSRKLVSRMLQRTGYAVVLACDGEEAVNTYSSDSDIALVLMDVQMPRMSGHEATKQIRDQEKLLGSIPVPIIALSAGAMKGDQERGISFGMTDYLTKPVDFSNLVQTLDRYLGSPCLSLPDRVPSSA